MKKPFSLPHLLPAGAIIVSLLLGEGAVHAQSTPPARTYHVDQYGRETKVVKERWGENASGQKHGTYLRYYTDGTPVAKFTYVNGKKNGDSYEITNERWGRVKSSGAYVNDLPQGWWTSIYVNGSELISKTLYVSGVVTSVIEYSKGKRSATYTYTKGHQTGVARVFGNSEVEFASGQYVDGKPSGTWLNAANSSEIISYKKGYKLTFADGKAVSATNTLGKPVALVSESEVAMQLANAKTQKETANRRATLDPDFFVKDNQFKQSFLQEQFRGINGEGMRGDDLIKSGILKQPDISDLIRFNPNLAASIIKMSFIETGVSPIKMIMTTGQTAMDKMAKALIDIHSPQVSGELLYWALRGVAEEKRVLVEYATKDIISRLGNNSAEYKALVEKRFYDIALAEKQYDPKSYPLRRWLYEQYKKDEPYLWMNKLTADAGDDAKYPERPN
ncbi:hypothetical protein Q5H92_24630 [Hymenobacter sp. M29]|uniref:MORN repeat variant n=1 Tax=Hymenobacter mellowenesis TaxID=3063995 RepID=A0ABT9AIA6_9BACT|nr:hypothetical protein [Hymenobacter sp. M29]MDO7849571.1 hypothetical protein [Hymenobacter sp. M29]